MCDPCSREGSAESEPSFVERLWVEVIHDALSIDIKAGATSSGTLYLDVIPMIGFQKMLLVGIFL